MLDGLTLFFTKGACSLNVRIILNELGIGCEFKSVDLRNKKLEDGSDYFSINPKGAVPALRLADGQILTEGTAIVQFLAEASKANSLLAPVNELKRYRTLEWLSYLSTEIHKAVTPLFHPKIPDDIKKDVFVTSLKNKLSFVNSCLENKDFLVGNEFTLADSYLFIMLFPMARIGIELEGNFDNLANYVKKHKERPSIAKSLSQEGL